MSKPKPKVAVTCSVCGKVFMTARSYQHTCGSQECQREYNRRRVLEHYAKHGRKRPPKRYIAASGLTSEQMHAIDRLQDGGDMRELFAASQSWSAAEHKYARSRYRRLHGI